MTSKTFNYAGVATRGGKTKAKFASDSTRVKVLAKTGFRDIDLIELKHPMTKVEACQYLLSINFHNGNDTVRAAIQEYLDKHNSQSQEIPAPVADTVEA
jgi:hypothetical protein